MKAMHIPFDVPCPVCNKPVSLVFWPEDNYIYHICPNCKAVAKFERPKAEVVEERKA